MDVTVSDAKGLLTDLVRRAEGGEEIVLTRHGQAVVRLVPIVRRPTAAERGAALDKASVVGSRLATPGPDAARSQDFLYDDNGLPG